MLVQGLPLRFTYVPFCNPQNIVRTCIHLLCSNEYTLQALLTADYSDPPVGFIGSYAFDILSIFNVWFVDLPNGPIKTFAGGPATPSSPNGSKPRGARLSNHYANANTHSVAVRQSVPVVAFLSTFYGRFLYLLCTHFQKKRTNPSLKSCLYLCGFLTLEYTLPTLSVCFFHILPAGSYYYNTCTASTYLHHTH